jgi:hypothetical protein
MLSLLTTMKKEIDYEKVISIVVSSGVLCRALTGTYGLLI